MQEKIINCSVLNHKNAFKDHTIDYHLEQEVKKSNLKIIVLDDDPTGVQTIHDIHVYTSWDIQSIREGFLEKSNMFFLLTNSRAMTANKTTFVHTEIARNIEALSKEYNIDYVILSRGDSTLRGHYPLETNILKETIEVQSGKHFDGEILCPYFNEGGRFTVDNIHYVKYNDHLVPCGQTEFAQDETFGYISSNLAEYIEEKTKGIYKKEDVVSISLETLRALDYDTIVDQLISVEHFNKIIVNATNDSEIKVFIIALYRAMRKGKRFMIRCAASFVKAMGNISDRPLLSYNEIFACKKNTGGIIVIGSHTKKTTLQLEKLKELQAIKFIELNSDLVLEEHALKTETQKVIDIANELIKKGITVCVSTKRTVLNLENDTPEACLMRSVEISNALQSCVGQLEVSPSFVVAKGGITSSDIATKALSIRKALVLGQIISGIPVWQTGAESIFPSIPYIIFPGNVGEENSLKTVVDFLMK